MIALRALVVGLPFTLLVAACSGAPDEAVRVSLGSGPSAPRSWCAPGCATPAENDFEASLQRIWSENGWGTPPEPGVYISGSRTWNYFTVTNERAPYFQSLVTQYATIDPVNSGWYDVGDGSGGSRHEAVIYDPSNPPNMGGGGGGGYY